MTDIKHTPPDQRRRERGSQDPEAIEQRFEAGSARMGRIEVTQQAMKVEQSEMRAEVSEVLEILRLGKSFFKVIGHLGSLIKWAAAVGAPVVAFYYALKAGGKS